MKHRLGNTKKATIIQGGNDTSPPKNCYRKNRKQTREVNVRIYDRGIKEPPDTYNKKDIT